jgi:threonine dehydrogenase-like Zn-dependent dehydrogenase
MFCASKISFSVDAHTAKPISFLIIKTKAHIMSAPGETSKMEKKLTVPVCGPTVKGEPMTAVTWSGSRDIRVVEVDRPALAHPEDVILRVTSSAICGSDLHLYTGNFPKGSMTKGDILGHEFMGKVHEVGDDVKNLAQGDRVVCCFDISCGRCDACRHELYTLCDKSNDSTAQERLYRDKSGGYFGYSHLTGGWAGGQADYVRVPFAEQNLLKVPSEHERHGDLDVILLSDVLCTAWHACEMGNVSKGDTVAIWGAGPVGILTAQCAQHRGAKKVLLIDQEKYRLDFAERRLDPRSLVTLNGRQHQHDGGVAKAVRGVLPHGPDVCIEAVGFHYASTLLHKAEMSLGLETDPADVMNEIFTTVRKGGRVSVVGVYLGYVNHFNFGCFMEKGLTMKAGQTPVQRYWKDLLKKIENKDLEPRVVITHELPLEDAARAYQIFNDKQEGCVKVVLHTRFYDGHYPSHERGVKDDEDVAETSSPH